jgi:hypothetical protein
MRQKASPFVKGGLGGFNIVIQIIVLEALRGDTGLGGFNHVHSGIFSPLFSPSWT